MKTLRWDLYIKKLVKKESSHGKKMNKESLEMINVLIEKIIQRICRNAYLITHHAKKTTVSATVLFPDLAFPARPIIRGMMIYKK